MMAIIDIRPVIPVRAHIPLSCHHVDQKKSQNQAAAVTRNKRSSTYEASIPSGSGTTYSVTKWNKVHSSIVSFALNLRPARSADRNRNWFPYSSNSIWGSSITVVFVVSGGPPSNRGVAENEPADAEGGRVEYKGTANENMEFCFGRTVPLKRSAMTFKPNDRNKRTFKLILLCHHFESILRFVNDDTGQPN